MQVNGIAVLPTKSIIEPKFGTDRATNKMDARSPVRTTTRCQHISMKHFQKSLELELRIFRCEIKTNSKLSTEDEF